MDQEFERLEVDGSRRRRWLEEWQAADADVARQLDALLAAEADLTPYEVAGAVSRGAPAGGLLFVGASSPIRDLDLMVPRYDVGGRRKVIANRGLSGIDGTVSTAIGAALGRPATQPGVRADGRRDVPARRQRPGARARRAAART